MEMVKNVIDHVQSGRGTTSMTVYKLKGRVLAVMAVIGTVALIWFTTQFYGTERKSKVDYSLPSELESGLHILGTAAPAVDKTIMSQSDIYAIVFDGGSTGSRVHVFKFQISLDKPIELLNETFEQVKPGLSSYAADPLKAAQSLDGLLETCLQVVPKHLYASTPLILKATAGLRLLKDGQADNILNEVTAHLKKYPFRLVDNGIGIMDGIDEGVFSWITVNFMLGRLSGNSHSEPALDLGGGSTQITFVPTKPATLKSVPAEFMKNVNLFRNEYQLYTHRTIDTNNGLNRRFYIRSREAIAMEHIRDITMYQQTVPFHPNLHVFGLYTDDDPGSFNLTSVCIPPTYKGLYIHAGKDYTLTGTSFEGFSYFGCEADMKELVSDQVKPVMELADLNLHLFSYFFERAEEAELIDHTGGTISLLDFRLAALKEFAKPNLKMPFQALDLTYIYSLLHYGYHIPDHTQLHLKKKIAGVEVSWAVGAAFPLLTEVGLVR